MELGTRLSSLATAMALAAVSAAAVAPAPWHQADFAADLFRAAAQTRRGSFAVSPWGVADHFAKLLGNAQGDTARGMAFALQLGGAEAIPPDAVAATFGEARIALARAARADASVRDETGGAFRFSAKFDAGAAAVLETPLCSALRLPCRGGTFELLALTPSPSNTLAQIEARLGRAFMDRLAAAPQSAPEETPAPRLAIQDQLDLAAILAPMGMAAFFADNAAGQSISIAIDGEQAEATVMTGPSPNPPSPTPPVSPGESATVEPPFLFLIRETRTGLILFVGRACKS